MTAPDRPAALPPGTHVLDPGAARPALLRIPAGHDPAAPGPLVLALHGAGGDAAAGLGPLADVADAAGLVLVSPASSAATWGVITGDGAEDVARIREAVVASLAAIGAPPRLLAVSGFSDGASAALALGLDNGDRFPRIAAFSPGYAPSRATTGRPAIYVSHGTEDAVLPVDRCSRRLVPRLRAAGYDVQYHEFVGGHVVPPEVAAEAAAWLAAR